MNHKRTLVFLSFFVIFQTAYGQRSTLSQAIKNKYCARNTSVDYIVVGVGTAGAVVAKILTDDMTTSVLALHSGDNLTQDPIIKFSRNAPFTVASAAIPGNDLYEQGETTPQTDADDRELLWVIAKPEGGASSVNIQAWNRGSDTTYAQWQAIAGPQWSIARITELYRQLETYNGQTLNPAVHGFDGPVSIRQAQQPSPASTIFTNAIINATGFPFVLDYNDPTTPIGTSSQLQYTQSGPNGVFRVSSATAFLNSSVVTPDGNGINGRKLKILFEASALRTLWSGNTAIGVEFSQNGIVQQAFANKGVIVCAGLRSSAFLMYSGVGPQSLLQSFNIPVKFNNPNVGQLIDQPMIPLLFSTAASDTPLSIADANAPIAAISFLPDPTGDPTLRALTLAIFNVVPGIAVGTLSIAPDHSKGAITINSSDPLQPPVIDLGILSNPLDLQLYQNALQIYINNINQQLQLINPQYTLILPDPAILTDPLLVTEFIKESVISNLCYQSHCRMAPFEQGGVVDSTGRVYVVNNLFVADDSIAPVGTNGTPMATAYVLGANIASMITATQ